MDPAEFSTESKESSVKEKHIIVETVKNTEDSEQEEKLIAKIENEIVIEKGKTLTLPDSPSRKRKAPNDESSTFKIPKTEDPANNVEVDMKLASSESPNSNFYVAQCMAHNIHLLPENTNKETKLKILEFIKSEDEVDCSMNLVPLSSNRPDYMLTSGVRQILKNLVSAVENSKSKNTRGRKSKIQSNLTPINEKSECKIIKRKNEKTPLLLLTVPMFLDPLTTSGTEIVKKASEWLTTGRNNVYNDKKFAFQKNTKSAVRSNFFQKKGFEPLAKQKPKQSAQRAQVEVFQVEPGFDLTNLETLVTSSPICIIRGLGQAVYMDFSLFDLQNVAGLDGEQVIDVRRQRSQHSTKNIKLAHTSKGSLEAAERKWNDEERIVEKRTLAEYAVNYDMMEKIGWKCVEHAAYKNNFENQAGFVQEAVDAYMKYQLPLSPTAVNGELYDRTYPLTSFATNVDLKEEQKFQPLIQELDKLPNFLKTKGGLNEYIKESIGGVNEVQMYFKQPGSRTTCHIENQAIGSLNLNLGPGKCIWYAVASEHSAKFEQLLMKKNLWPYDSVLWPNEEELLNWGIPVMKFIQETDDTVYVGTGTYHWVQSIGFTGNVSWNIAESTFDQFAMAALVHDHNTEQSYDSVLPIIPMAWEMAKKRAFLGTEMYPLIKSILARSLAKSTFELDKAKSAGAKISNIEDASVELSHVERCQGKKCKRDVLFNTVVIKQNSRNKTEKLCVDCCHNMKGSTVIMRHTINELVTIYNEY